MYQFIKRFKDALFMNQKAIETDPGYEKAWARKILILTDMTDFVKAR